MRFGSVCSGIEAASVAWGPLGWTAAWFSEIEPFPSAVLAYHYPTVPNLGDMRLLVALISAGLIEAPDLLCGGTPCQAFSVAGLRRSLDDDRGNLTLTYCRIANAIDDRRAALGKRPSIQFWENVPGVLSTADNAFGCFLAELAGEDEPLVVPGQTPRAGQPWKWPHAGAVVGPRRTVAWRTMDAQFTGVAQRRRRVFVVASARDDFDPVEVLFEFDGVRRDTAPSRETAEDVAGTLAGGARSSGGYSHDDIPAVGTLTSHAKGDNPGQESKLVTVGPLMAAHGARGHGGSGIATQQGAEAGHVIAVRTAQTGANGAGISDDLAHTLDRSNEQAVAFGGNNTAGPIDVAAALNANRGCHNPGDFEAGTLLTVMPFDTTQITSATNRCQPSYGAPCHPLAAGAHPPAIAFSSKDYGADATFDLSPTLRAGGHAESHANAGVPPAIAFHGAQDPDVSGDVTHPLAAQTNGLSASALVGMRVRRLMPIECERLQAFPDNYTLIPTWNGWRKMDADETPESCRAEGLEVRQNPKTGRWSVKDVDGPRYKALGNSWVVSNVRWIGERIDRAVRAAAGQGVA